MPGNASPEPGKRLSAAPKSSYCGTDRQGFRPLRPPSLRCCETRPGVVCVTLRTGIAVAVAGTSRGSGRATTPIEPSLSVAQHLQLASEQGDFGEVASKHVDEGASSRSREPTRGQLVPGNGSEMAQERPGTLEDLGACGRVDARVDPHDARARLLFDGDQEATVRDVERQRPNEDRLALLEPDNDGSRDADRRRCLGAHEIDARPGEGAAREVTRRHDPHTPSNKVQLERGDGKRLPHVILLAARRFTQPLLRFQQVGAS